MKERGGIVSRIFDFGVEFGKMSLVEIIRDIYLFFMSYCIVGWLYEEIDFIIEEHVLENRGFLFGPWLPVYGVGGIIIVLIFFRTRRKPLRVGKTNLRPLLLWAEASILGTMVELLSTYAIDARGGDFRTLWSYDGYFINFQGRIALWPASKFGILALLVIYFSQSLMNKFVNIKNQKAVNAVALIILILFVIDLIARIPLGSDFVG